MPASSVPYFHSSQLRLAFARHLQQALDDARISAAEQRWLQRLIDDPDDDPDVETTSGSDGVAASLPRVERLVTDARPVTGGELDNAWIISDPDDLQAPLFLDCLSFGLERFADRDSLYATARQRYLADHPLLPVPGAERVEGDPFTTRMLAILDSQAAHLEALGRQLDALPSLHAALGDNLQAQLQRSVPQAGVDVFQHLVQVVAPPRMARAGVIGTRTLADVAFQDFGPPPAAGVPAQVRHFMDASGTRLEDNLARPWQAAIAAAGQGLTACFEALLETWWQGNRSDGVGVHRFAVLALAETFRHELLHAGARESLSEAEVHRLGSLLRSAEPVSGQHGWQAWQLSLELGGQGAPKLAGTFMLTFDDPRWPALYLFSAVHGVRRFDTLTHLERHFASAQGLQELQQLTSLNEHADLRSQKLRRVRKDLIDKPLFARLLDSVIALQKRNLQYVLGLAPIHHLHAAVRVDDALDIRHLLDRRLLQVHDTRRWPAGAGGFAQRWGADKAMVQPWIEQLDSVLIMPSSSWHAQLGRLDQVVEHLCQLYDGAAGCMRLALNRYLAVFGADDLDARDLWLAADGRENVRLMSLALAQVSGHASPVLPAHDRVLGGTAQAQVRIALPGDLLGAVLERVRGDFVTRYQQHLRDFLTRPLRWLDTWLRPGLSGTLLYDATLRLELSIERRLNQPPMPALYMLQQLLDQPTRTLRQAMGRLQVEAYRVELLYDLQQPGLALADTLVMEQPALPGSHVLWSLCDGLSLHGSLSELTRYLNDQFDFSEARHGWMKLLGTDDQARLQHYLETLKGPLHLVVRLQRLDGHCLEALLQEDLERRCRALRQVSEQARPWKLPADLLQAVLRLSECDEPERRMLDGLGVTLEAMLTDALLPQWMKEASIDQLFNLSALIKQWYLASQGGDDVLFGIPEPRDYSRARLLGRLQADHPGIALEPEAITVTITRYTPAPVATGEIPLGQAAARSSHSASLTDYAIGRLGASQDGTLSVAVQQGPDQPPLVLAPEYVSQVVRELDIAAGYRQLLEQKFLATDPDHAARFTAFVTQMPILSLLATYAMLIRDELSEQGYRFVAAIMAMPDSTARLPVFGQTIIISPLLLRTWAGAQPDPVTGVFVIAPQDETSGPWLLFTQYNADFMIQEYTDRQALLDAIHDEPRLQDLMLSRLDPEVRAIYDKGGFRLPHLPFPLSEDLGEPRPVPEPVSLVIRPMTGNVLQGLFDSLAHVLSWWFGQSSVTNAEDDRQGSKFLWALGAEQVLALLPGRLGALVGLWQTQSLAHASVIDGLHEQWGKAASELLAAMGVLISSRQIAQEKIGEVEEPTRAPETEPMAGFPDFSWSGNGMTATLWSQLYRYQVRNVALDTLNHDPLLNIYQDLPGGKIYAPVGGAVYQVSLDEDGWHIVGDEGYGPRLTQNDNKQWQLNLRMGLRGGGGILTRFENRLINVEVDNHLIVQAQGMAEIRRKFRTQALNIIEAHALARRYLENCLDNLAHRMRDGQHHVQVRNILQEFFDTRQADDRLIGAVERVVSRLYGALMDSSLSPFSSSRYVVGVGRSSADNTAAFTFPHDSQKRIYFTERYFRDPVCRLKPHVVSRSSFNPGAHSRASTLIHELSHLYCYTEDMAYLEAQMPFVDLLEDHSVYRSTLKSDLIAQQRGLSYRTPRSELFRLEQGSSLWVDIKGDPKHRILSIVGVRTLEEARDVFYSDVARRTDVILANADSVALLVTVLGRKRLVP